MGLILHNTKEHLLRIFSLLIQKPKTVPLAKLVARSVVNFDGWNRFKTIKTFMFQIESLLQFTIGLKIIH